MLHRAVKHRQYDWEPIFATMLQAYKPSIIKSTGITPLRLGFGREMHLPVDLKRQFLNRNKMSARRLPNSLKTTNGHIE